MKQLIVLLLFLLSLNLLALSPAYAWTSYTHNWICEKAGLTEVIPDIDCAAADTPELQSRYTDASFRNHHCTENMTDCSARKIADKYVQINTIDAMNIAAHLYADSLVPVHWYSTDYNTCHKIFEDKVEEKLRDSEYTKYRLFGKEYDFSTWSISMQCIAKYGKVNKTVELYADDKYMESVASYVAEMMGVNSEVNVKASKEYNLTPMLIFFIILLIIILILFFYFGLKNKNREKKKSKK